VFLRQWQVEPPLVRAHAVSLSGRFKWKDFGSYRKEGRCRYVGETTVPLLYIPLDTVLITFLVFPCFYFIVGEEVDVPGESSDVDESSSHCISNSFHNSHLSSKDKCIELLISFLVSLLFFNTVVV
jgi:hypothetical protein